MVAAQMTRVLPKETRTEPLAWGATLGRKEMGRSCSGVRPSGRLMGGVNRENAECGRGNAEFGGRRWSGG